MAYITTADLTARLGSLLYARLTDRVDGKTASASVAQQIIDEAQSEADSYLSVRYATPINISANADLEATLQARVLDFAEYGAWKSSPFVGDIPGRVRDVYLATTEWFKGVARGAINLPAARPIAGPTAVDDSPRYSGSARKFTGDELDGL